MQIKNKKNTRKQQEKTEEPYKVPPCILVRPIAKKLVPALLGCAVPAALIVAEVLALLNGVDFTEGAIEIWTLPVMLLLFWVIGVVIRDVTVPAIQKSTKNIEYLKGIIYWLMKAMKEVKTRTNYSTANYDLKYALRYFVRDDSDTDLIRRIVHDMS